MSKSLLEKNLKKNPKSTISFFWKKSLKSTDYSPGALRKQNVKIHDPFVRVSFKKNLKIQKFTIYSSEDPSEQFLKIQDLLARGSLRKQFLKSIISLSEGTFEKKQNS